jgi:SHS2 domain-containing protein
MVILEQPQPFTLVDHTADVGLRATGASAAEALGRLILGHAHLLCGGVYPRGELVVDVDLPPCPELALVAVDALRQMARLFDTRHLIARSVSVATVGTDGARFTVTCGPYDAAVHGEGMEIKAITYHAARFEPDGDGFVAQVIVDV